MVELLGEEVLQHVEVDFHRFLISLFGSRFLFALFGRVSRLRTCEGVALVREVS